jgi:DNA polymerase V
MLMGAAVAESLSLETVHPAWITALEAAPTVTGGWPLLATPIPAGAPTPADATVERHFSLDAHLIRHPEATFLMRVQGNELGAQGIQDGDLLVIDRDAAPSTGSLVVIVSDGQFSLARVGRDAQGQRVMHFAAPEIADRRWDDEPAMTLWGVVRWTIHRLWPARLSS